MLYPVLGWVLALGRPRAVPWALIAVNLAAAAGLAAALAALAAGEGRSAWQGLLALAISGVWIGLALSTYDVLAVALLAAALLAATRGRPVATAAALGLAALTRELQLLHLASFLALAAWRRDRRATAALLVAALPPLAWNLWVLRSVEAGSLGFASNFGLPFAALLDRVRAWPADLAGDRAPHEAASLALFLAVLPVAGWGLRRAAGPARGPLAAAAVPFLVLVPFAGAPLLDYAVSYLRPFALLWLPVAAVAGAGGYRWARGAVLAASTAASVAYLARQLGWPEG